MPIIKQFTDPDKWYEETKGEKIIVNDLEMISERGFERVQTLLVSKLKTDSFSISPKCQCGKTEGNWMLGRTCNYCGTNVTSLEDEISPLLWIRKPRDIVGFLSPDYVVMLRKLFMTSAARKDGGKRKFDVLRYMMDTSYSPSNMIRPPIIDVFLDNGLKRGYNSVITNLGALIEIAMKHPTYKPNKGRKLSILLDLYNSNKDVIISKYVPIVHKQFVITEKTAVGNYVDGGTIKLLNAVQSMVGLGDHTTLPLQKIENTVARVLMTLSDFYAYYYKEVWASRNGHFRKHMFGTRMHFAFRAVISSLTSIHMYDELHVPWGIGLTSLRPMIINKLVRLKYTHDRAVTMLYSHINKYHPLLDEIMQEIISESKHGGLVCMHQRNPSQVRGSAQRKRITKVKIDPNDQTVSGSILTVTASNADFDGDQMNNLLMLDDTMADLLYPLSPHYNVVDTSKYRQLTGNMDIPKPVISSISNWLSRTDTITTDTIKEKKMMSILT